MPQSREILDFLMRGKTLTPLAALNLFGCNRLAARIHDLRADGFDIRTDYIKTSRGKRIARYALARLHGDRKEQS